MPSGLKDRELALLELCVITPRPISADISTSRSLLLRFWTASPSACNDDASTYSKGSEPAPCACRIGLEDAVTVPP